MAVISCREVTSVALITTALGIPATLSAQQTVFKSGVEMVPLTVTVGPAASTTRLPEPDMLPVYAPALD